MLGMELSDLAKLAKGEIPTARESVSDCIIGLLAVLLDEYSKPYASPLAVELDNLVKALRNKKDPMVKDIWKASGNGLDTVLMLLKNFAPKERIATNVKITA